MPYLVDMSGTEKYSVAKEYARSSGEEVDFLEDTQAIRLGKEATEDDYAKFPDIYLLDDFSPALKGKPPCITGWSTGSYGICEKLKNEMERLEPGVHGFLPMRTFSPDRKKDYGTYYYIYCRQSVGAYDEEHTYFSAGGDNKPGFGLEAAIENGYFIHLPSIYTKSDRKNYPVTLHASMIEGMHFWRGTEEQSSDLLYFCSDELHDFIQREELKGWQFYRCWVSQNGEITK